MPIQKTAANAVQTIARDLHEYVGAGAKFTKKEIAQAEKVQAAARKSLNNAKAVEAPKVEYSSPFALVNKSTLVETPVANSNIASKHAYTSPYAIVTPEAQKSIVTETTGANVGQKLDIIEGHMFG